MNNFEKLDAWKESHKLVLLIYKVVKLFPSEEKFRLTDQLCRAASSIPANLVEGGARAYRKEYIQYCYQARGSLEETKYHLILARDLGYLKNNKYEELFEQANTAGRLINGLISYLRSNTTGQRINKK